jgi:hypothetical protein
MTLGHPFKHCREIVLEFAGGAWRSENADLDA